MYLKKEGKQWAPAEDFYNRWEQWPHWCPHSGEQVSNCQRVVLSTEHQWWLCENIHQTTPSILESVHPIDPAFIDRQTQVDTAASGAVAVWAGRGVLLDSIVTMDETWVHCSTLDSKCSSMQCLHPGSPKPKKAKTTFTAWKVMAIIFWDSKGVLYMDILTGHRTINTEYYSALVEGPVKTAVRNTNNSVISLG